MKLFEVITEFCRGDSKEITRESAYVTSHDDNIVTVTVTYAKHCEQYEKLLISVREVLSIVHHIVPEECPDETVD